MPEENRVIGEVSRKTGRGRQTTRQVELLKLDLGGFVADTPGFSQLDITHIVDLELGRYFPEINEYSRDCRFGSCMHRNEPDCGVREAVAQENIAPSRLASYLLFLEEIEKSRPY